MSIQIITATSRKRKKKQSLVSLIAALIDNCNTGFLIKLASIPTHHLLTPILTLLFPGQLPTFKDISFSFQKTKNYLASKNDHF